MNMRKFILFLLLCPLSFFLCPIQANTYWVQFTDKAGTIGTLDNPTTLSERALERREAQGIAIDSLDLPVSQIYRDSVLKTGATFVHQSRWHNGISIETNDSIAQIISTYAFVHKVEKTQSKAIQSLKPRKTLAQTDATEAIMRTDVFTQMLCLDSLHNRGYKGTGKHIAVVDNGFINVNHLAAFAQANIMDTYDFVKPGNDVYLQGNHGTMVLSTMAAQIADLYEGTATEADYYLLRTEDDDTESIREVDAQVAAFEYADSVGADIITSSLGYFYFDDPSTDFTYANHNGRSYRNSMAATIAARKGILLCISAGNEGNATWHYISTPADADSILTVGAVRADREHAFFSSYGPTADKRIKPDVCTMGQSTPVVDIENYVTTANGTSFSCPIMAGAAACLWSALPELTAMQLRDRIIKFASQAEMPDNTLGYGIPNIWLSYTNGETAIKEVEIDNHWTNAAIYDLQGRFLGTDITTLEQGIYIQRKGNVVRKIYHL